MTASIRCVEYCVSGSELPMALKELEACIDQVWKFIVSRLERWIIEGRGFGVCLRLCVKGSSEEEIAENLVYVHDVLTNTFDWACSRPPVKGVSNSEEVLGFALPVLARMRSR